MSSDDNEERAGSDDN